MQDINNLIQVISNVGFPVVVALYLLIRVDKTIEKSTEALTELTKTIIELKELISRIEEK
ncbi:MAG: YvrJ family protein [Elusimicrobiota bacterium]|nr:YvrJ family protein [Endomicrobiia bacterium]MDW8165979.1 YvrJ family protein [Elusimicrobiota bacterium]